MKLELLEEIRARAEAATPGPWTHGTYRSVLAGLTTFTGNHAADAGFVRHAREDIPNLLALVDALTAENARLRGRLDSAHDALTRIDDGDDDAFTTLESTVEYVVPAYRQLAAEHEVMDKALDAVRRLCQSYTPEPPPLFRGPGLSEHGEGYNHGTRDMAAAVLGVLAGEEEST